MSLADVVVIVLAGMAAFRGWRRGLLSQVFELGGGLLGLVVGVALGPRIAGAITDKAGVGAALISLAVVFVGLTLGQALGFVAGHRFGTLAHRARLGEVDAALGSACGVVVAVVSFWLIGSLLVQGPSKDIARALRKSAILKWTNSVMPPPPNVLAYLRQYLDTSGFPQVFAGLPRPIGPPVKLPSNAAVRRAYLAADQSTVRIVVPACGGTQLGSGWVAASSTVVTNAHVVSGGDEVTVQDGAGDHPGEVVVFNPKTDVAIVHVDGVAGPPLDLETATQERGRPGVTIGFPGTAQGQQVWHRAAVQARYEATGRDIYGRAEAEREVYEIRSRVRQGDSGGPFVLSDGSVAGVIFAASTTDQDIGYALTGAEISDEVARGSNRTEPVSTGRCTH